MRKKRRVLIVGSGGREVALYEAIKKSSTVSRVFVAPGNDYVPAKDCLTIPYERGRYGNLIMTALSHHIDLVVVGPDDPVVYGIWDAFNKHAPSIPVVAPSQRAAELEGSKIFMKTRCVRWGIPTANFDFAGAYAVAERIIKHSGFRVIKADGLCEGKGVTVAHTEAEALNAAHELLVTKKGRSILLEELLVGTEFSYIALCDGENYVRLPSSRDYKRLRQDSDLMTGGMGAYSPVPDVDESVLIEVEKKIIDKLVEGMAREGRPYRGVLYAGIMLTKDGPLLLEVNCRFGDPEAQVILPQIKDIVPHLWATTQPGRLSKMNSLELTGEAVVCVCVADKEYPVTGHRLFSVVGTGATVAAAREEAYRKVRAVPGIENFYYRDDIAAGV